MSAINDGGPAFPFPDIVNANGDVQSGCNGMSLRDWFAGQALAGLMTISYLPPSGCVELAWYAADKMIAAREKGQG
jgi:hypothetical protein